MCDKALIALSDQTQSEQLRDVIADRSVRFARVPRERCLRRPGSFTVWVSVVGKPHGDAEAVCWEVGCAVEYPVDRFDTHRDPPMAGLAHAVVTLMVDIRSESSKAYPIEGPAFRCFQHLPGLSSFVP
jgi:hypothetical protein